MICPNCERVHYRTRCGIFCSKSCRERYTIKDQDEFLTDLPLNANVYQEGGLLVIGTKSPKNKLTREQLLKLI